MMKLIRYAVLLLPLVTSSTVTTAAQQRDATAAEYNRDADQHSFTVFLREGGWCWYQDPRAIVHRGQLIIGAVQGNGSGAARIGVYDLERRRSLQTFIAHDNFDRDDHNSPVFYPRPDGSVLAVYARHGKDKKHYMRISDRRDLTVWGDERVVEHDYLDRDNVTYMNLYYLREPDLLYNFFRGFEFNPAVMTSSDHGRTWHPAVHFIRSEIEGRHRPYARYAANGVDTVHISFTDGHPHRFGNSIYYAAFRNGRFFTAGGRQIKSLTSDGPLRPGEAHRVFQGGGDWAPKATEPGVRPSAARSAWTSSMVCDERGYPHIGYSLYLTKDDHRYRIASWDGARWVDREVAFAGKCLYGQESSYTGLITIDPEDPRCVVISTDVDPATGRDRGGRHEIYRAFVGLDDDVSSIEWTAVTHRSPVRNIRPVILRNGDMRYILWNRGEFRTYQNYQLDTVGFAERTTTP